MLSLWLQNFKTSNRILYANPVHQAREWKAHWPLLLTPDTCWHSGTSWATPFPTRTIEVSGLEDHWGRQSGEQFETGKGQTWPCEVFQKHFQSRTPRRGLTIFFTLSLRKTSKLWNQSGHFFPLCVETEFWFYHINCRFYFTELDLKQIPQSTLCPERKILTNLDFLGVGSWN